MPKPKITMTYDRKIRKPKHSTITKTTTKSTSSESVFGFPSTTPPSCSISGGSVISGQKTYGKGRTILGQDLDSIFLDPFNPSRTSFDMGLTDDDIKDNLAPKKLALKHFKSRKKILLKSSRELREVGDNTSFTDEMDYIFGGIENRSINVRRNSVMDLLSKLLDRDFLLKIRAHNYISKIYTILDRNQDLDKNSSVYLIKEHDFVGFVVNLLNTSSDPLSTDCDSLKKSEKLLVDNFKEIILKSTIFKEKSQISLKSIALRILTSLSTLKTRNECEIKRRMRTSGGLLTVIKILKSELELVDGLLSAIENGKSSQHDALDFKLIEQCLKILEYATLFCSENQIYIVEDRDILHMLLELLLYFQVESFDKSAEIVSLVLECLLATLKVLINLTNENLSACQYVGSQLGMSILMRLATVGQLPREEPIINNTGPFVMEIDNIENSESVDAIKFDVLLLSIGLLINLVETDPNNQDEFRKVDQYPMCPGSRKCMRTCTCLPRVSAVSCLVSLYNYHLGKDDDKTDSNIVAAYMARLPDRSVGSLINLLQQFVHFNELVGEEATANGHVSGQMLMSSSSLENQGRTIGDSFLEIVDMLKSLES
ncbi:15535_t:CDS:10 [Funneliformis geosporum]|uniref:8486_t:CDS:1 n=1 Tax=Funneliformis geosporum TaxID=1117311 RepID=A0A9W4WVD6_9GLOM|nr:15535_t:CDS:10 [Funneliformis geosporum]CAI2166466.1 8486_t:CDS:10 [Funneliformis geosporum]